MDMEENYYYGQEKIKQIQKLMKEVEDHALCRPNEDHQKIITVINENLKELHKKLEF